MRKIFTIGKKILGPGNWEGQQLKEYQEQNVDKLNDQINTTTSQWEMTNVRSDVSGYVEQLNLKVGETFTGMAGNNPQIVIVNSSTLKAVTEIPENYLGKIHKGMPVNIKLPDVNLEFDKCHLINEPDNWA